MNKHFLNSGKIILGLTLAMLTVTGMQAQPGHRMQYRHCPGTDSLMYTHGIPGLTEDQGKKMADLRNTHQKAMLGYRNDLAIKKAELQKYKSADKPDMALINKTIDEIGKLSTEMQKKQVSHELAVRDLLTAEQRVVYDARRGYRGHCGGHGMRHSEM